MDDQTTPTLSAAAPEAKRAPMTDTPARPEARSPRGFVDRRGLPQFQSWGHDSLGADGPDPWPPEEGRVVLGLGLDEARYCRSINSGR